MSFLNSANVRFSSTRIAPLVAAVALFTHAPTTFAAEPAGDAQSQARSLLLDTPAFSQADSRAVNNPAGVRAADAQEQARNVLLAKTSFGPGPNRTVSLGSAPTTSHSLPGSRSDHPEADAQERAKALILGRGV